LYGIFEGYKDIPLISYTGTDAGIEMVTAYLSEKGFNLAFHWSPIKNNISGLDVQKMQHYHFENYDYPEWTEHYTTEQKEELLVQTRLELRRILEEDDNGYVFSFWPDVLTLKEIGNPKDIGTYFDLWEGNLNLTAKNIVTQCRQNTNYKIVRYAAHPFFLEGYTLCANGENTFYTKNKEMQQSLHKGYLGFESDSQCFLYTLHYVHNQLKWPVTYYKHVLTPLPFKEIVNREDKDELLMLRQSLSHLEINGPNTIIALLPDNNMFTCCDSKKLRPVVIGRTDEKVVISSEVCGINLIMPKRDLSQDIYPNEREIVNIDDNMEVSRWKQ
jgi:glutamate synthase domain-containing protein 1